MSNATRTIERQKNNKASLYNDAHIDFTKEPMFFGAGRNTQRFDVLKYKNFDKLNDDMQGFDWKHDEVSLIKDIKDFRYAFKNPEKFVLTRVLQKLIFLDSLQGRGPFLILGQIATLPELENAILTWTYFEGCVVPETEVCTPNGWKKIDEITTSDDVLCCDINGYGGFNKPKEIHKYKSNGHITKFEGKNISQFVSDQHRMLLVDSNNQRKIIRCQDMSIHNDGKFAYGMVNALTATNDQSLKQSLTDHERFLIALQADGSIYRETIVDGKIKHKFKNGNYSGLIQTTFDFRKTRKQNRFRELIKKLGYQYQEVSYIRTDGKPTIKFSVQVPRKLIISKYFNDWINLNNVSSSWCKEFINELKNWDGWDYNRSTIGWDTTEELNVDIVEIISTIAGYKCSRGIQEYTSESKANWKDLHRLTFNKNKNTSSKRSITATKETYTGFVHCLSVPGDFFVIRHNGKISITGNCKHSRTYTEELRALYDHPDKIFDESFEIPELLELTNSIKNPFERAYFNVINYIYKTQRDIELTHEETIELYDSILMVIIEINTLEGIRFYTGFAAIWALTEGQKYIPGTSENLCFISRDENIHLALTQHLLKNLKKKDEEGFKEYYKAATERIQARYIEVFREEVKWVDYLFSQGSYLGMNANILKQYLTFITIKRMKAVGIKVTKEMLDGHWCVVNPIPWVDKYINMDSVEKLPQEENVLNYVTGGVNQDVDESTEIEIALQAVGNIF